MPASLEKVRQLCHLMFTANPGDHFHALGMAFTDVQQARVHAQLPYRHSLVGNPENGIIHGGALTALLDTSCGFAAVTALDQLTLCPTMDLRIDHMRPAKPGLTIYAEAEAYRITSNVIFCRSLAYQEDKNTPIAHCVANFTRMDPNVASTMSAQLEQLLDAAGSLNAGASPSQNTAAVTGVASESPLPPVLIRDALQADRKQQQPERLLEALPYAKLLGIQTLHQGEELRFHLPPSRSNVGNPTLPALHGGAIAGFMEMSAAIYLLINMPIPKVPRVVDFSIDYIRAGQLTDTYASCSVVRQGRRLVNVSIHAWQRDQTTPIATARAHFLID
ncbi:MAG: hotdog domain-containing protein [Motiliproteus sp.]